MKGFHMHVGMLCYKGWLGADILLIEAIMTLLHHDFNLKLLHSKQGKVLLPQTSSLSVNIQ